MKVELTKEEWQVPFNRLIAGLIQGEDIRDFSISKDNKEVSFFIEDFSVTLKANGKWEIA
jgi:hypothetical protein